MSKKLHLARDVMFDESELGLSDIFNESPPVERKCNTISSSEPYH